MGGGGGGGDDWRRELEALRDMFLRERERNNRLEEQVSQLRGDMEAQADELAASAEALAELDTLRQDVERLRVAVARLGKEKGGDDGAPTRMVAETAISRLEEEIEGRFKKFFLCACVFACALMRCALLILCGWHQCWIHA